jgi:hypothetical protein
MIRGGFLSAEDRRHLIALAPRWLGGVAPDAAGERFGAAGCRNSCGDNEVVTLIYGFQPSTARCRDRVIRGLNPAWNRAKR